jgi:ribonucleoside-diphosphate reductase alpha chain
MTTDSPVDAVAQEVLEQRYLQQDETGQVVETPDELMAFINETAWEMSKHLADERGAFPNWEDTTFDQEVRNATTTTIAPTGSISLIAGCSASIEPIYNVAYTKYVLDGLDIVNDRFIERAHEQGFYSDELLDQIRERTSIQDFEEIPADIKELFPTAHDIAASHHVRIQAAFQEHVDNTVSKTVNLPADTADEDIKQIVLEARDRGCKGITVFRSGTKRDQVLGTEPRKEECLGESDYVEEP